MTRNEIAKILKEGGTIILGDKFYTKGNLSELPNDDRLEAAQIKGKLDVIYEDVKFNEKHPRSKDYSKYFILLAALLVGIVILILCPNIFTRKPVPEHPPIVSTVKQEEPRKALKFTRLMRYDERKVLIELPHLTHDYSYTITFPDTNAVTDKSKIIATKEPDRLMLQFCAIETKEKQFSVEIIVQ